MRMPPRLLTCWPWLALLALLGLVALVYWPGLSGPFLLDDWGTLPKLGAYGPVDNFDTFVAYITSGIAGPSGRPIALASFLIDAHNWPAPPWSFKFTNLLLHLLNGVLLAWLLRQLSAAGGLDRRRAVWAGLLGAGLWMAHPLLVSTTLYVVQRMAILAALFVFAGLNFYVVGRMRLAAGRGRNCSAYALMIGGIVGGTVLGFFSKENAALLPLLALVLEFTVLRRLRSLPSLLDAHAATREPEGDSSHTLDGYKNPPLAPPSPRTGKGEDDGGLPFPMDARASKGEDGDGLPSLLDARAPEKKNVGLALWFRAVFLWLPSLGIAAYLLWECRRLTTALPYRNFTILERVLTEARVVVDYLYLLVIPHGGTSGLYTHFSVSHGLLDPWTTLPAILLLLALLVFALAIRKRLPILAAGILFYFAGMILESTTIPLELYYEHRNYLPAALLLWPLAWWCVRGPRARALRIGIGAAALVLLLGLSAYRADLWSNGKALAMTWMRLNPDSSRAVVWGAENLANNGHHVQALKDLRQAVQRNPTDISIALSALITACQLHAASPTDLAATEYATGHSRAGSTLIYKNIPRLAKRIEATPCPPLTNTGLLGIPRAALDNPHFAHYPALKQEFLVLRGRLLLRMDRKQAAYQAFSKALPLKVKPDTALIVAAYMYVAHAPRLGLKLLDEYRALPKPVPHGWNMKRLHRWWLDRIGWYSGSFKRVRAALQKQLQEEK